MVKYKRNENWESFDEFKEKDVLEFVPKAREILNNLPSAYHVQRHGNKKYAIRHITLALILKELLNKSYRDLHGYLKQHKKVREKIGFKGVPHYAYMQQCAKEIDESFFKEFFKEFKKNFRS